MTAETILVPRVAAVPCTSCWMGETANDKFANDTERPRHLVNFAHRFAIGVFPVTVEEYRVFRPAHADGEAARWPVVNVSWEDATDYCAWLAAETGQPFRLPSEAEWECACRAGTDSCFATGTDISATDANYLYSETGQRVGPGRRQPVGTYPQNSYGLHDFHGNVAELTADVWHPNYRGAPCNGTAWSEGGDSSRHVMRGGAWDYLPRLLRSSWRDPLPRAQRRDNVGFRVAVTLP